MLARVRACLDDLMRFMNHDAGQAASWERMARGEPHAFRVQEAARKCRGSGSAARFDSTNDAGRDHHWVRIHRCGRTHKISEKR